MFRQAWRLTRMSGVFAYFFAAGGVLGRVMLPIAVRGAKDEHDRIRRAQRVVRRGLRHYHGIIERLGFGAFDYTAYEAALPAGPCVVVANHPTLLDIVAFLAAERDTAAVVKGALFRGPWLGAILRHCGHIDAGEGTALDGAAVMNAALERLREGYPVVVFPEGTRSPEHDMLQLKRGAFEIAVRAGVPILPVFVECEPPVVTKERPFWRTAEKPFRLRLVPLPLMDAPDDDGDARALRKEVQRLLRERVERAAAGCEERASAGCDPAMTGPLVGAASAGRWKWNGI